MARRIEGSNPSGDGGFGLIEIVVSIFLLGLLAIAYLPLLVQSLQASARNGVTSTASQLLNAELDELAAVVPYCDEVSNFASATTAAVTDDRGNVYQAHRELVPCPGPTDPGDNYPGVVEVTVCITEGTPTAPFSCSGGDSLASATTLVFLENATAPATTP
ncbi:type II secretion system protein [Herbiconiux sp. SYSU D00978]|uniref:type II secretion system protein n=1 Tax=Herbiconiux sp. SYSU D00978 TaxID=2812562 RepID=UPI001A964B90|nr:type II secretion system protein [Herbiconiux sp. SYSU D00978]